MQEILILLPPYVFPELSAKKQTLSPAATVIAAEYAVSAPPFFVYLRVDHGFVTLIVPSAIASRVRGVASALLILNVAVTVTNASGGEVTTTPDNSNPPKYKFTMPESNVTVTATFAKIPTYTVTVVLGIQNGTVTADKTLVTEGTTITLTATPAANYEFESFIVKDASGNAVTVTNSTFTMPASNVTVSATFKSLLTSPLTLEAIVDGTISVTNPWSTLKYTINGGALTAYSEAITVAAGDKVCFFAESSGNTNISQMQISCTSDCYVYGNIMSLVTLEANATDSSKWNSKATSITTEYAFACLFDGNSHIKNHASKKLYLPATTLAKSCYSTMFMNCTSLTAVPDLPATTLNDYCYYTMFRNCTALTTVPEALLPATTLSEACYECMFYGCTNLTKAPDLPAATLATECYMYMLRDCTSLTSAPALPATTLAANCYAGMFYGCTGLTSAPELSATTLATNCYEGMFMGCTNLTSAPALPATTLVNMCYYCMFMNCSSLANAPKIMATTVASGSCNQMFSGCTSLTSAPDLLAETLENQCYLKMFSGCTNLNSIKCLATDISAPSCTKNWLFGVAASGTFTTASATTWQINNDSGIPSGWTRKYPD